jgi:hypothetical protein
MKIIWDGIDEAAPNGPLLLGTEESADKFFEDLEEAIKESEAEQQEPESTSGKGFGW